MTKTKIRIEEDSLMEMHENIATLKADMGWIKSTLQGKVEEIDKNSTFRIKAQAQAALVKFLVGSNVLFFVAQIVQWVR